MQKNKSLILITLFFFLSYHIKSFDKKGLHCIESNTNYDIVFYFNHNKVFYLDIHYEDGDKIINDQFTYFKKYEEVGSPFLKKDEYIYWGLNPWNKSYTYNLDLKELKLMQKFVLLKKGLSKFTAKLFKKSEYFVEVKIFTCKILNWNEIEILFDNKIKMGEKNENF